MDVKYCPFVKGSCRDDCVFKYHKVATENGISDCLIAIKLSSINETQSDELNLIIESIKK